MNTYPNARASFAAAGFLGAVSVVTRLQSFVLPRQDPDDPLQTIDTMRELQREIATRTALAARKALGDALTLLVNGDQPSAISQDGLR